MKKTTTSILLIMCFFANAQENQLTDLFTAKLGIIGSWVSYEKVLNDDFTINTEIGLEDFAFRKRNGGNLEYSFSQTFSVEPRFYYNRRRRINKNKIVQNNTGNFVGLECFYINKTFTNTNAITTNPVILLARYGINRRVSNHINFEFITGIGKKFSENSSNTIYLAFDIRFSYVFKK